MAYDVDGTGRTAIKMSIGKYLEGVGASGVYASTNPTLRMPRTTPAFGTAGVTRTWTDANANFVPDCDLRNPGAQDLRASGGDFCGVLSNVDFGKNVLTNDFDPNLLAGWGVRPADWSLAVSIQQQIGARSSVDVTYIRRSFRGFTVADNRSLQPTDLTPFSIVAPLDSRLPGGGGYVIEDLYDVVPDKAGQINNLVSDSRGPRSMGRAFQWPRHHRPGSRGRQVYVHRRNEHRSDRRRQLRGARRLPELATTTMGTSVFGGGRGLGGDARQPLLSRRIRRAHAAARPCDLHGPQGSTSRFRRRFRASPARFWLRTMRRRTRSWRRRSAGTCPATHPTSPSTWLRQAPCTAIASTRSISDWARSCDTVGFRTVVGVDVYNVLNSNAVLTYNNTLRARRTVAAAADVPDTAPVQAHGRDRLVRTAMQGLSLRLVVRRMVSITPVLVLAADQCRPMPRDEHKQVLVLYSTRPDAQFSIVGERELPESLDAGLGPTLDYYSEFMDLTHVLRPHRQRVS